MINIYKYLRYSLSLYVCAWFGYLISIFYLYVHLLTPYIEDINRIIKFQQTLAFDHTFYIYLLPYFFALLIHTIIFIKLGLLENKRIKNIIKPNINLFDISHCIFVLIGISFLILLLTWFFIGEITCLIQIIIK